jgi:hypothetical protein
VLYIIGNLTRGEDMSFKKKASSFLSDLLDGEELQEIVGSTEKPEITTQFVVYYLGDKPDTVWEYNHKPEDGIPYGRLYGYWDEDPDNKGARKFREHKSNNLKLMDFDTFMDRVPPNKDCTKIFDSEADFLLELI